jgi:hypothetical protein
LKKRRQRKPTCANLRDADLRGADLRGAASPAQAVENLDKVRAIIIVTDIARRAAPAAAANARLIAAAPAMDACLRLLALGSARIVVTGSLVEFAFNGIRYCHNGDWSAMVNVIGWDIVHAALNEGDERIQPEGATK